MESKNLDDIIRDNTPRLRSYVRSRVNNNDDADDIVQDTLYKFLHTISIMDNPIGQVTSWLYTVAHNLVINHSKKQREVMADLSEIMVTDDDDTPDMLMLRALVWEELDKALSELPEEQRIAVHMTEIQGKTVRDAAREMGVSIGTFLSRKHYAVVHIRKRLNKLYEELTNK